MCSFDPNLDAPYQSPQISFHVCGVGNLEKVTSMSGDFSVLYAYILETFSVGFQWTFSTLG